MILITQYMINLTVLKTYHCGSEEAKKLELYLNNVDIYVPEVALSTENFANQQEKLWEDILENKNLILEDYLNFDSDDLESNYLLEESKLLKKFGIKKWHLERFEIDKIASLEKYLELADVYLNLAYGNLNSCKFESAYDLMLRHLKVMKHITFERDKEIYKNLLEAEDRLKLRYSEFKNKKDLKMVIQIGGMHNIEPVLGINISTIDLMSDQIIYILNDRIINFLDSKSKSLDLKDNLLKLMMIGNISMYSDMGESQILLKSRLELESYLVNKL